MLLLMMVAWCVGGCGRPLVVWLAVSRWWWGVVGLGWRVRGGAEAAKRVDGVASAGAAAVCGVRD